MAKLKVPSLQHLARLSKPDASRVAKGLLSLLDNSPTFSYEPLYVLLRDMLVFKTPYDQLVEAIQRKGYREDVQNRYLDILPLAKDFFDMYRVDFTNPVLPRYYLIDRDLQVPFVPPMIFGSEGKIIFPWFIFWKDNPLKGESLSLFVTLVDEILSQDPDLEESEFLIVDLSFDPELQTRTLKTVAAHQIPRLSEQRKQELLRVFADGFRQAKDVAAKRAQVEKVISDHDKDQLSLL